MSYALSAALLVLPLVALSQALVWQHARAMTTFRARGARTLPPEDLSPMAKARTLLFGVTIPRPEVQLTPADRGLPFSSRAWRGPGGHPQQAWWVAAPEHGPRLGTVILWHGYAAVRDQLLDTAAALHASGWQCVLADFPGSGDGPGDTTTLGLREAESVSLLCAAVAQETGEEPVLYGFSMGGGAILEALARLNPPARAAVVEATFATLHATVQRRFRLMGLPGRPGADLLLFWGGRQAGFDPRALRPVDRAAEVKLPVLVVQGRQDARVPEQDAVAIHAALGPASRLLLVDGLGHEPLADALPEVWLQEVSPWLAGLEAGPSPHPS